jgi:hypothetical protein
LISDEKFCTVFLCQFATLLKAGFTAGFVPGFAVQPKPLFGNGSVAAAFGKQVAKIDLSDGRKLIGKSIGLGQAQYSSFWQNEPNPGTARLKARPALWPRTGVLENRSEPPSAQSPSGLSSARLKRCRELHD